MRGFWKLTWVELKLYVREPAAAFFTLAFPLLFLFVFGAIYGNAPNPFFGGQGFVDTMVPAYAAAIIATAGLMSLSISIAAYREQKVLRRFRAAPIRPAMVLGAQVVSIFVMTAIGLALLVAAGKIVYGLRFSGSVPSVAAGFVTSCLSIFALGFVVAGLMPTVRAAQSVSMVLYFPMLFLSGASIPREVLPKGLLQVTKWLPLSPVVDLLRGLWKGDSWGAHLVSVVYLAVLFAVGLAVSARTFRWE